MRRLVPLVAALPRPHRLAPAGVGGRCGDHDALARWRAATSASAPGRPSRSTSPTTDPAISGELRLGQRPGRLVVVRRAGRPADRLTQALRPLRPAVDLRPRPRRHARLRRDDRSPRPTCRSPPTTHINRSSAWWPRSPARSWPPSTGALADPRVAAPAVVSLAPEDLPARVEAWSAIDRLVWQDVDTGQAPAGAAGGAADLAGPRRPTGHPRRLDRVPRRWAACRTTCCRSARRARSMPRRRTSTPLLGGSRRTVARRARAGRHAASRGPSSGAAATASSPPSGPSARAGR